MPDQVKILSRERVFSGYNGLEVYCLQRERFAGGMSRPVSRELLIRGPAVSVLPYDPVADRLVLIQQFRIGAYVTDRHPWLIEVPAGNVEAGETLADVARREALEELGRPLARLEPVCTYLISPGCSTETMHLFAGEVDSHQAEGVHGVEHEDEDIRVFTVAAREAIGWLDSRDEIVSNANLLIALQWFALHREELRARWRQ